MPTFRGKVAERFVKKSDDNLRRRASFPIFRNGTSILAVSRNDAEEFGAFRMRSSSSVMVQATKQMQIEPQSG